MNDQVSTPELEVSTLSNKCKNLGKTKNQLFWLDFQAYFGLFNLEIWKMLFCKTLQVFEVAILRNLNQPKRFSYEEVMAKIRIVVLKQKHDVTWFDF